MKGTFSDAFHEKRKMGFRVITKYRSFDNKITNMGNLNFSCTQVNSMMATTGDD